MIYFYKRNFTTSDKPNTTGVFNAVTQEWMLQYICLANAFFHFHLALARISRFNNILEVKDSFELQKQYDIQNIKKQGNFYDGSIML